MAAWDYHLKEASFIKLGPLQHLKLSCGDHSVFIINDDDTGISNNSMKNLNLDVLRDRLIPAINNRFDAVRERATFDSTRRGHLAKMMVGFTQEFGALTSSEIVALMSDFNVTVNATDVDQLMLCAEAAITAK